MKQSDYRVVGLSIGSQLNHVNLFYILILYLVGQSSIFAYNVIVLTRSNFSKDLTMSGHHQNGSFARIICPNTPENICCIVSSK